MPAHESEKKTYFQISYGRFRLKSDSSDPKAQKRENAQGKEVWERVFNAVEGQITSIYYREDKEYGNSFEVTIDDGKEKFNLSFKENSRYCQDFLSKLPNVRIEKWVKIVPYDFTPKDSEKNKQGITLWQDETKLENFFVRKDGEKWVYSHGFPESTGDLKGDEWDIYLIQMKKFLRAYVTDSIIPGIQNEFLEKVADEIDENTNNDDLPF